MWKELTTPEERQAYPWAADMRVRCRFPEGEYERVVKAPASPIYNQEGKLHAWVIKFHYQFGLSDLNSVVAVWEEPSGA